MPFRIGLPELIIVLVIVVLVFGVGKFADLGGALGKTIRDFRKNVQGDDPKAPKPGDKDGNAPAAPASNEYKPKE